jgi:hypothetical protein
MQILRIDLPKQTLYLLLDLPLAVDGQGDDTCTEQEHGQGGRSYHTGLLLVALAPLVFKPAARLVVWLPAAGPVDVAVEIRVRLRIRLVKTIWFIFLQINTVLKTRNTQTQDFLLLNP